MWTGGGGDRTTDPVISGHPTLASKSQTPAVALEGSFKERDDLNLDMFLSREAV